mgnify:CR=1 FL=1
MSNCEKITAIITQSLELESSGQVGAALQKIAEAISFTRSETNPALTGKVFVTEAWLRFRLGQYAQASQIAEQALPLLPEKSADCARAWIILGNCAGESGDLDDCEEKLRLAADICRETGSPGMLVGALHNLCALIFMPRGQFKLSLATDQEALRVMEEHQFKEMYWAPLVTISWVYWLMGQKTNSRNTLKRLEKTMVPGSIGEGYYHTTLANLAVDDGQYNDASAQFATALSISEACGDPALSVSVRLGLSRLNRASGDVSTARHWAADALTIAKRVGYHHMQSLALVEHGRAAWGGGDLATAESDFLSAIEIMRPQGFAFDLAVARLALTALRVEESKAANRKVEPALKEQIKSVIGYIKDNGFGNLLDQERAWTYTLVAFLLDSKDTELIACADNLLEQLKQAPLEPLRVHLLGGLQIWRGEKPVPAAALKQRRAGELFALLLMAPQHTLSDEQAAEEMAPDKDHETAKQILYHASSTLRRALEPELTDRRFPSRYLIAAEGSLRLNFPPGSSIDTQDFEEAARTQDWQKACQLYQGDFLPEYHYADWAITKRESLALTHAHTLLEISRQELAQQHWDAALDLANQLIVRDPWNEEAVLVGMQACLGLGDRSNARKLYLRLVKTLKDQLSVEPQPELRQLYQQSLIRRN